MENITNILDIRFIETNGNQHLHVKTSEQYYNIAWLNEKNSEAKNKEVLKEITMLWQLDKTPIAEKSLAKIIKKAQEAFDYLHPEEFAPSKKYTLKGWEYDYFLSHKNENSDAKFCWKDNIRLIFPKKETRMKCDRWRSHDNAQLFNMRVIDIKGNDIWVCYDPVQKYVVANPDVDCAPQSGRHFLINCPYAQEDLEKMLQVNYKGDWLFKVK